MRVPVVIDTDGGVDDAVALWWAATHPDIDLLAVTIVGGNVPRDVATGAVLRVLHAAGRPDVPVAIGLDGPVGPAPHTHGRPCSSTVTTGWAIPSTGRFRSRAAPWTSPRATCFGASRASERAR